MKNAIFLCFLLTACAAAITRVPHTVLVKGTKDSTEPLETSPATFSVTFYELYVGKNSNCSDLSLIRRFGQSGRSFEIYQVNEPVLISAKPEDDTYECVAVKLSDQFVFTTNEGAPAGCEENTVYTYDAYPAGSPIWRDLEGNDITPQGTAGDTIEDPMYLVLSTNPAEAIAELGVAAAQVFSLTSAIDTTSPNDLFFFANFHNQVVGGGSCYLNTGAFGLSQ